MPTHPHGNGGQHTSLLTDPSPYEADGVHFTVEWTALNGSPASWERIESSWEIPEQLTTHAQATNVARTLALRFDGDRAYRVVDPKGKVLLAYAVQKRLLEERPTSEKRTTIPPGFAVSLVADVLPPGR